MVSLAQKSTSHQTQMSLIASALKSKSVDFSKITETLRSKDTHRINTLLEQHGNLLSLLDILSALRNRGVSVHAVENAVADLKEDSELKAQRSKYEASMEDLRALDEAMGPDPALRPESPGPGPSAADGAMLDRAAARVCALEVPTLAEIRAGVGGGVGGGVDDGLGGRMPAPP